MTGIFQHAIDAKGRLFIPARLREELGDIFYVTISMEKCLWAHSLDNWQKLVTKIGAMSKAQQIRMRPLFAHATKCELDGQGRILLTKELRDRVGLKSNVTVVGAGEWVEFWDSETWAPIDEVEAALENMAQVFMELDI